MDHAPWQRRAPPFSRRLRGAYFRSIWQQCRPVQSAFHYLSYLSYALCARSSLHFAPHSYAALHPTIRPSTDNTWCVVVPPAWGGGHSRASQLVGRHFRPHTSLTCRAAITHMGGNTHPTDLFVPPDQSAGTRQPRQPHVKPHSPRRHATSQRIRHGLSPWRHSLGQYIGHCFYWSNSSQ